MNKNKVSAVMVMVAVITFATIILVRHNHKSSTSVESMKIGAILPLTGSLSFLGQPQATALEIARQELQGGGTPAVLIVEDNRGDAASSVTAARKLISVDKVKLAFVTTSAIANAVAPLFQEAGIPLITICSDETISERFPNSMNFYVGIDDEITAIVAFLKSRGARNIAMLRVEASVTAYALSLLRTQYKDTIQVAHDETYKLGETIPRGSLEKIKAFKPDAILLLGYGPEFPAILKIAAEMDIQVPIIGNYSMAGEPARKLGTSVLTNAIFTAFPISVAELADTPFGKQYMKQTGEQPRQFLDYVFAYEALRVAGDYWKTHAHTFSSLQEYCRGRTFKTLFGDLTIDKAGNGTLPMVISKYNDAGLVTPLSH
jgi:branched-chain amino acid transport system substrate-binding protein